MVSPTCSNSKTETPQPISRPGQTEHGHQREVVLAGAHIPRAAAQLADPRFQYVVPTPGLFDHETALVITTGVDRRLGRLRVSPQSPASQRRTGRNQRLASRSDRRHRRRATTCASRHDRTFVGESYSRERRPSATQDVRQRGAVGITSAVRALAAAQKTQALVRRGLRQQPAPGGGSRPAARRG
jgi:hypothetical protein